MLGNVPFMEKEPSPSRESRTLQPFGLFTILIQLIPELGMSYLDECFSSLSNRLAVQIGNTALGDHIANQSTRCDHTCAWTEERNDPRNCAVLCRGRHCNDRFPALGPRSAAQEVDLSADAAVELVAYRVGAYLAGEINLQSGVDCHHVVIARN